MNDESYQLDPNHPANRGKLDKHEQRIASNDAHRVSMLPCSASAGQLPDHPKEPTAARTEVERLFPDKERVARVLAARKEAGL